MHFSFNSDGHVSRLKKKITTFFIMEYKYNSVVSWYLETLQQNKLHQINCEANKAATLNHTQIIVISHSVSDGTNLTDCFLIVFFFSVFSKLVNVCLLLVVVIVFLFLFKKSLLLLFCFCFWMVVFNF